jgi:hypothetical protein
MAAKILRHPRTGQPLKPRGSKGGGGQGHAGRSRAAAGQQRQQRGRQNHSGYPDGHGPGGYAGTNGQGDGGDETVVVCEAPSTTKKKFPWGTVLLTGLVSTVGVIAAYKVYEKMTGGDKLVKNPDPEPQQGLMNARDYLLLTAPGAEQSLGRMPQQPQVINAGASAREIELMERETALRERMAEMEGFIQGQQAAAQQQDSLSALLEAAEGDD